MFGDATNLIVDGGDLLKAAAIIATGLTAGLSGLGTGIWKAVKLTIGYQQKKDALMLDLLTKSTAALERVGTQVDRMDRHLDGCPARVTVEHSAKKPHRPT